METKELREDFELRDLRRTGETMLAALTISSDIRGQIQLNGLGGVQARHFDRHVYMAEKRATLELWNQNLDGLRTGEVGQVVPMHQHE